MSISTCFSIAIYFSANNLNIYQVTALFHTILHAHFWILWFKILASCNNLHHFRIIRRKSPVCNLLWIPCDIESDKNQPFGSVSALIGLRGSNAEKIPSALIYGNIGINLTAIINNMVNTDSHYYSNLMAICCVVGYWLMLTCSVGEHFKADLFHYVGVIMTFFGGFGAVVIQQNYSSFVLLLVLGLFMNYVVFQTLKSTIFKRVNIHYQSMLLLLFESYLLFLSTIACARYFYDLTDDRL